MSNIESEKAKETVRRLCSDVYTSAVHEFRRLDPETPLEKFVEEVIRPALEHLGEDGRITLVAKAISEPSERPLATMRQLVAAIRQSLRMLDTDRLSEAIEHGMMAHYLLGFLGPEITDARRARQHRAGAIKGNSANFGKLRERARQLALDPKFHPWASLKVAAETIADLLKAERSALDGQMLTTGRPGERIREWLAEDLSSEEYTMLFPRAARARARKRARPVDDTADLFVTVTLKSFSDSPGVDPRGWFYAPDKGD